MVGARPHSRTALAALLLLAIVAGLFRLRPISDPDLPWHILAGKLIVERGVIHAQDFTSFTMPGKEFVNPQWLANVFLYTLFRPFGWSGMTIYAAVCAASSIFLAGIIARRAAPDRPWLALGVTALAAGAMSFRFDPRPHATVLVALPATILIAGTMARRMDGGRGWVWPAAALLALMAAWVQFHPSFILLPSIVAVLLAGEALRGRSPGEAVRWFLPRSGIVVALVAFFPMNPFGWSWFNLISEHSLGDATAHIGEMQALDPAQLYPKDFDAFFWLDCLLGIAGVRALVRRKVDPADLGLTVLGLALAFTATRFRAIWALLTIPLAARGDGPAKRPDLDRAIGLGTAALVFPLLAGAAVRNNPTESYGLGLSRLTYAADLADALEKSGAQGRLFNHYDDGGWLQYRLYPRVQIAIDGRTPTFFDDELYFLVRRAHETGTAFDTFDALHGPDMALVVQESKVCRHLRDKRRWPAAYVDARRVLFTRSASTAAPRRFEVLDPCDPHGSIDGICREAPPDVQAALRRDLAGLSEIVPQAPFPAILRARFELRCGGDPRLAIQLAALAAVSDLRQPDVFGVLAETHAASGDLPAALDAATIAIDLGGGLNARIYRGRLRLAGGDPHGALEDLQWAERNSMDLMPAAARLDLARALAATGDVLRARLHARRAAWTGAKKPAEEFLRTLPTSGDE